MKKQTKIILTIALVVILIAGMVGAYFAFRPKTEAGAKTITLEVVDDTGKTTSYQVHTDAEYLIDVMTDAKKQGLTFDGENSEYGLSIYTVNGLTADFNKDGAYWAFYVNGEYCNYGVEQQPANDGDEFSIQYTVME